MGLFPSQLPSISGKIKPEMACRNRVRRRRRKKRSDRLPTCPHPHPNHRLLEAVACDLSIIAPDRGAADRLLGPSFRVVF